MLPVEKYDCLTSCAESGFGLFRKTEISSPSIISLSSISRRRVNCCDTFVQLSRSSVIFTCFCILTRVLFNASSSHCAVTVLSYWSLDQ
jgi:hypothetical protein